jgi:hypothetical protein
MAILAPPILPSYLYRYRSLGGNGSFMNRELEAIKRSYIWCSTFSNLNDPMEGFYSPSALLKAQHDYREIAVAIYRSKISFGIAALSDTYDNELMWTHYADQYRGICVQYYAERMFNQLPPNSTLARIGYVNQPTRISTAFDRSFDEAALRILSQKKSSWAYEREWRAFEGTNVDVWSMTIDGYDHFWDRIQDAEWRKKKARKKKAAAKKKTTSRKAKKSK